MKLKQELQQLHNHLDKYRRKLTSAEQGDDHEIIEQFKGEIDNTVKKIAGLKDQQTHQAGKKGDKIKAMAFSRALTKPEQADLGKLKKAVPGLVVVHPMSALGREIEVKVVTGFSPAEF